MCSGSSQRSRMAHRALVGEIELADRDFAVARRVAGSRRQRRFARLRTPDRERHCSARRGERTGGLDPDAGACAGDDCPFSMKAYPANNLICGRTSAERDLHALVMDER